MSKLNYFELDGKQVAFFDWGGNGKLILLVHGWNGQVGNFSRIIPDLLKHGFHVIGLDLPGHGTSEGRYSNVVLSGRSVRSLTEIIGNPFACLTHSFGGAVATIAQELGTKSERLVYICPPLGLSSVTESFSDSWKLTSDEAKAVKANIEKKIARSLNELDLPLVGENLSNKLLLIHDEDDLEIPTKMGKLVASSWKDSEFHLTKGLGHRRILRDDDVKNKILKFLKS